MLLKLTAETTAEAVTNMTHPDNHRRRRTHERGQASLFASHACLMSLAMVEPRAVADDIAVAQDFAVAAESRPPTFANNDRFHNLTLKARISVQFRSLACDAEELDNPASPLNLKSGSPLFVPLNSR